MYREAVRCPTLGCHEEVGYRLADHGSKSTLVEARRRCSRCGAEGLHEDALLWDIAPAHSDYKGLTLHQMALAAHVKLHKDNQQIGSSPQGLS